MKQKQLRSRGLVPHGGMWIVNRPELGLVGRGYIFSVLADNVRRYREANAIPIGLDFERDLENLLCEEHPEYCEQIDPKKPSKRSYSWQDVMVGTRTMANMELWKLKGNALVSKEEAERRAAICVQCNQNIDFKKPCAGVCGQLKALVKSIVGNEKTSKDVDLKSCAVCACFLSSAVWVPLEVQWSPLTSDQKELFNGIPNCWKKAPIDPIV